jgi:Holliday junction resolvase
MSNKKLGNDFETQLCELLFEKGYWAHNLAQNASGQPADVLAVKDGRSYLIDCKVCSNGKFPFSRMEENQDLSMSLWEECGNGEGWFALKLDEEIYMVPHSVIVYYKEAQGSFNAKEIRSVGLPVGRWLER